MTAKILTFTPKPRPEPEGSSYSISVEITEDASGIAGSVSTPCGNVIDTPASRDIGMLFRFASVASSQMEEDGIVYWLTLTESGKANCEIIHNSDADAPLTELWVASVLEQIVGDMRRKFSAAANEIDLSGPA